METYQVNIPPLDALASGVDDYPAGIVNGITVGDNLQDANVIVSTIQHENRKRLAEVNPPYVTDNELMASKRRKHLVQACHFSGTTPPWAVQMQASIAALQTSIAPLPAMQTSIAALQTSIAILPAMQTSIAALQTSIAILPAMQTSIAALQTSIAILPAMQTSINNLTLMSTIDRQRSMNRSIRDNSYPVERVGRLGDGALPPTDEWFPETMAELTQATGPQLNSLLAFYELPAPRVVANRVAALKTYLGITL
jgi:hypothetical protein